MARFATDFRYTDRRSKAEYVWLKYRPLLENQRVLDVGADACHLREYLPAGSSYCGVGLGDGPHLRVDLERERLPFEDRSFDCVLCLDVLEHLDDIHAVFDELCRVSARYVVISLPNPWRTFWAMLTEGWYAPDRPLKFYGLPGQRPEDRHKWFFSISEAERFIAQRADANRMRVVQSDHRGGRGRRWRWRAPLRSLAMLYLFGRSYPMRDLTAGTLWVVLERVD